MELSCHDMDFNAEGVLGISILWLDFPEKSVVLVVQK